MKSFVGSVIQFFHRLRNGITLSNSKYEEQVDAVNRMAQEFCSLNDDQLRRRFDDIRQQVHRGARPESFAVDVFAVVREVSQRTLGMRPFNVQLLAAFALCDRTCVEMRTGEGKTLAAALVVCLRALDGHGVHVLTFNDYLAKRDSAWMTPLYRFLDLTVGHVDQGMPPAPRRAAYNSDITYVTAREAGFDFLRDQMCDHQNKKVQRGFPFAIVDEADSILIDEARIPLVIAAEADRDETDLYKIAELVRPLARGVHFDIKAGGRNVSFTERGLQLMEQRLGIPELHSVEYGEVLARLTQALHADRLLTRDIDYIVRGNSLELIDEFTGRVAENRKWPGGLQAALEAKEKVEIQPEGRILNAITLQHFLEQYDGLAGMTGTAVEGTEELEEFYNLKVVVIPPNQPCVRTDHDDRIFSTKEAKYSALITEVDVQHSRGQPVLIGTASVDESELLAGRLEASGISCRVLNAANDHLEAEIIAEAGAFGAVTISTNMAGRGTDIRLGGSQEESREAVIRTGGLYVIGTNRHESRRIDHQLRGRSGRQGDPGESRFFVSLQDDLISKHGIADLVSPPSGDRDTPIDDAQTARRISHLQRVIEGECFEIRRTLRMYAFLPEVQRRTIGQNRDQLLDGSVVPTALARRAPDLRQRLVDEWGEGLIADAERRVTLAHLDWCWSDHLAHAGELREGIHLVSLGGFNAFDTFNKEMNLEFATFRRDIEDKVAHTMSTATFTSEGIDLEEQGLTGPSSTWTFMINDNPRGAVLNQLLGGIKARLKSAFR